MASLKSENSEDNQTETVEVTIPEQKATAIPLFLKKLWKMVNDTSAEQIIGWNPAGDGFVIYDQLKFATELLPQYFKHNNLSSFVRQLNFYDFHKVANIDRHEMEFSHSYFLKDLPETLSFITRKVPNVNKSRNTQNIKHDNINEVLNGVKELKNNHSLIENELKLLKQENAALWSEINSLRIKYSKQTKVINKLIHFLISYMHSHQNTFNKTNIVRKKDQHLLRNSPQLFQIDYHKPTSSNNERKTNFKIPTSSGTVTITTPNIVKNSGHNFTHKRNITNISNSSFGTSKVSSKKYPLSPIRSYPLKKIITEINPEFYNVSSPEQYDGDLPSTSKLDIPIEEIDTEVDPKLEETSIYTVKFPKSEVQNTQMSSTPVISPNIISKKGNEIEQGSKLACDKRRLNDNSRAQQPKMLKISQRGGKTLKLTIPTPSSKNNGEQIKKTQQKAKQSLLKRKKKIQDVPQKAIVFPQLSSIKPEVVLENLFTEIGNQSTEQNIPTVLSDLPTNDDDLGPQLDNDPTQGLLENQPEVFLFDNQQENILQNSDGLDQVAMSPTDFLSGLTANPVDPLDQPLFESSSTEMLSSLPTASEPASTSEMLNVFNDDLESYPDEMLSSLSTDLPQVVSPSRELLKYNIIENPKENLGMYLDNTQIQLTNIQDILNDLNSEELFDFLTCFNVDDEDDSMDQKKLLGITEMTNEST